MRASLHNVGTCARLQLTLTVGLFLACAANVVLVCAWL
ncbi:MAG: glucose transporter [Bradyrhizobium sp.]